MPESELSEGTAEAPGVTAKGAVQRTELDRRGQGAARRVAESKATVPHAYVRREVAIGDGTPEEVLARLIAAAGSALAEHPGVNGAYRDGAVEHYARVNISVPVETADGVRSPTLFDADALAAHEIAEQLGELRERAASGALTAPETSGSTFTLSPPVEGADDVAAAVTPGQAAHLCAGRLRPGGLMTLTLCFDLRALRPSGAGRFLGSIASVVEGAAPPSP